MLDFLGLFFGSIMAAIGVIGFLIAAFKQSIWWALGCFFIWPVSLVFLVLHWQQAKNPFFLQLVGAALLYLSGGLAVFAW